MEFESLDLKGGISRLVRHPIFVIAIIGIAIRLVIMPLLSFTYDTNFWALIIRNFESGNGLYGLEGYYYTPVWGYFLGFWSFLQESFMSIDLMGMRSMDLLELETYSEWHFTSSVNTIEFNFWVKFPFLISDLILGYLTYWLIKDRTGDVKKASFGFAICFLCPVTMLVTSISGMFDTFSAVFMLLSIILFYRGNYVLGGMTFTFAALTKFFPAFLLFVIIAYILKKHKNDGAAIKNLAVAIIGAAIGFLILMGPHILDGTFVESFSFISNRSGGGGEDGDIIGFIISKSAIIIYIAVLLASALVGHRLYRSEGDIDNKFLACCFLITLLVMVYPPTPQYVVILVPMLSYYIAIHGRELMRGWIVLVIGTGLFCFAGNFVLLVPVAEYTSLIDVTSLLSWVEVFQTPVAGITPMYAIYVLSGAIQYVGIVILMILTLKRIREGTFSKCSDTLNKCQRMNDI